MNIAGNAAAKVSASPLFRIVPFACRVRIGRLWSNLFGNTDFTFRATINEVSFCMQGPYRFITMDYYHPYLREGAYEAAVTSHITRVVQESEKPIIVDVGAHYGWYTLYLASLIKKRGVVIAFEPSPHIFSVLKQNVGLNSLENVRLYQTALSDTKEKIYMTTSKLTPWEPRYMQPAAEALSVNRTVFDTVSFDELDGIEKFHPTIVKIDVHGVWRKVIDGMKESLQNDVQHLYLELDTHSGNPSVQSADAHYVISFLREIDMEVYEIQKFNKREGNKIVKAVAENIMNRTGDVMIYAVKKKL